MITIQTCPITVCGYATADVDVVGAAAILNVHSHEHAAPNTSSRAAPAPGAPKLERPKLQLTSTTEELNAFIRRWETFRVGSSIRNNVVSGQLLECNFEQLGNIVLRARPYFTTLPTNALKTLAEIPVALGVVRSETHGVEKKPR